MNINTEDIRVECTCGACPEQYEIFYKNEIVCYVRLRWGALCAEYPDCGGKTIYSYSFEDDYKGSFDNDEERKYHINKIIDELIIILREVHEKYE